jgi:hyperosmotically inducible protein
MTMRISLERRGRWIGRLAPALTLTCALSGSAALVAQQPAPDNTRTNARDRQPGQPTADDQTNTRTDLQLAQEIRKALVADKSLSTYAHNVKVIAKNGKVTLKGPVRSAEEKRTVAVKAAEVAGSSNVVNQLSVAPEGASKKAGS